MRVSYNRLAHLEDNVVKYVGSHVQIKVVFIKHYQDQKPDAVTFCLSESWPSGWRRRTSDSR